MTARSLLLAALLAAAAGASAQQYKWVDRNGRVQYGDVPPPGATATPLRAPSARAAPPPAGGQAAARKGPPTLAEREAEFRKRREDAARDSEKQAKAAEQAQEKRLNCENARSALRTLETGRVARTNAQGEREYLDDAGIQREMDHARRAVQQNCN